MLVLSRRLGEKIFIGEDIEVVLIDIQGCQGKVGILAPKSMPILREEVAIRRGELPKRLTNNKEITHEPH